MFVRWIVRGHKNADIADVTFHDAYLVESYRDDEGKPRQRTISYLGNIRQIGDTFPGVERGLFLLRADIILESIPNLSESDCDEVMQQLYQKVPPLSEDEVRRAFQANLHWYYRWWKAHGGAPSDEEVRRMIEAEARGEGYTP